MLTQILDEKALPLEELRKIGLADGEKINMEKKDIQALLSGNRTGLLTLENFSYYGMEIKELHVKLSLAKNNLNEQLLMYHPVYKQAVFPFFVSVNEADELITGQRANLVKEVYRDGQNKELMVEYDHDTKEFVMTDTLRIKSPQEVNGISLSPYQKERYKKGREIELEDGTRIQASSSSPDGIRSNRLSLVVSLLMDGGISYMLLQGLKALSAEKGKEAQLLEKAPGFDKAKEVYESQKDINGGIAFSASQNNLPSRGYTRGGMSR